MRIREDLDEMDKIDIFPSTIKDPKTKKTMDLGEPLECTPETGHETGMIFCKEKKQPLRKILATVAMTVIISVLSVLLFSVKITIKSSFGISYGPMVSFLPQFIALILVLVIVIVVVRARR